MSGNGVRVLIAHADGEADVAAKLAEPLREAGYDVVDSTSILVGESLVEKASEHLAAGWPVVICGTVEALGAGWVHQVVNAARPGAYLLPVRMERRAYLEMLSWDLKIAEHWQDPARAVQELLAALAKRYPTGEPRDVAAVNAAANAEARYRSVLLKDCDLLDLTNLPEQDQGIATRQIELRRLYVALRVQPEVGEGEASLDPDLFDALEQERAERRGVWADGPQTRRRAEQEPVPLGERLTAARRLVVLGDPGAGKSTLLRWLTTAYLLRLKQDPDWAELPDVQTLPEEDWLPVLVRCRDLGDDRPKTIEDLLEAPLSLLGLSQSERASTTNVLLRRLRDGTALLLVDGLDEINDIQARAAFCEQLEKIHVAYPKAPVVVTSRIVGYREMGTRIGRGFEHVTVADLHPADKDEFARRWCELTQPPSKRNAATAALIRDIHSLDRIERLTGNPLLLTTMALVRRSYGRLPNRRGELYELAVEVLLRWRPEIGEPLDRSEVLPQLEYIAYTMCQRQVQQLHFDELRDLCAEMRAANPNLYAVRRHEHEEFIRLVKQQTGLLVEVGESRHQGERVSVYEFRHLTFQEYLAGMALVRGNHPGYTRGSPLAARVALLATPARSSNPATDWEPALAVAESWREPIRLCVTACPPSECDDLVTGILQPRADEDAAETARPRAVLAAQCLADEPDASDHAAERVITGLVGQFWEKGDRPSGVTGPLLELADSRWGPLMLKHLVDVFLALPSVDRAAFPRQIIAAIGVITDQDAEWHEVVEAQVPILRGDDSRAAIRAALTIAGLGIPAGQGSSSGVVEALIRMVGVGEPVADAAVLAMWRLHDPVYWFVTRDRVAPRFEAEWDLSPAQHRLLIEVMHQQPIVSDGARISLFQLALTAGIEAVIPLARAALASTHSAVRAASVQVLGSLYELTSVPEIAALVHDPNANVRAAAARALEQCRDRGAFSVLAAALEDHAAEVRAAACDALGHVRHPDAGALLTRHIDDAEPVVRVSTTRALGKLGHHSAATAISALLSDSNYSVRLAAAEALGKLGATEHVDALLAPLDDASRAVRIAAGRSLCGLADRSHLPQLLDFLTEDLPLAEAATEALVRVLGAEAVPMLLENLETPEPLNGTLIGLTKLISPDNPETRTAMLRAAATSGMGAVDALSTWLKATDAELLGELATVVRHAVQPLQMLAVASSGAAGHPDVLAAARDRLDELGEDDVELRAVVATIQCAAGIQDGLEALTALLPRLDEDGQQIIASALANFESPPPEVVSVLLSLAAGDRPSARAEAARSLGRLDRPNATAALLRLLDDPVPWVRRGAVSSLDGSRIGQTDTLTNALLARLEDRSFPVRMEVVEVLGEAPSSVAVAPLLDTLANDISGEVRRVVPAALAKHGIDDTAAAALHHAASQDPDPLVRRAARKILDREAQDDG